MSVSTATPALPPNLTTRTQLLSPVGLNTSPHLPALFKLINHCFNISHNPPGHSYLPSSPTSRLKTHIQLSEEIGPDGFTIIMLAQDTSTLVHGEEEEEEEEEASKQERKFATVIATASAKPYIPPAPSNNNETGQEKSSEKLFKRQPGTDTALAAYAALPKWEILCMVVEPTLQGRGIAGQLMALTVEEIKRRVVVENEEGQERGGYDGDGGMNNEGENDRGNGKGDDDDGGRKERKRGKGEILLMLSSMQELNEEYYKKRRWETTGVRRFPPGTMGSRDGFGVVEMMKVVSL